MNEIVTFFTNHQVVLGLMLFWAFSAFVSGMPEIKSSDTRGYQWLYTSLHKFAGNLDRGFGDITLPGSNKGYGRYELMLILALVSCLLLGCGAARYHIHPGAINIIDSQAYDALIVAQAVIDQARNDLQSGKLPPTTAPLVNDVITSYDVARGAWLTYRGAIATGTPPEQFGSLLSLDIVNLTTAITTFKGAQ